MVARRPDTVSARRRAWRRAVAGHGILPVDDRGVEVVVRRPEPIEPGPGQESVWDYPRPPALDHDDRRVVVEAPDGAVLAESTAAVRVLETSHPPQFYLPRRDVDTTRLRRRDGPRTVCEFKGAATYWDLLDADGGVLARDVGWSYEQPTTGFAAIAGHVTVYPERVGRCLVDGEVVRPQAGDFYGGWITDDVVGPFKGPPGTMGW